MAITGVAENPGLLTSVNQGSFAATTGGTGERVLVDFKDALIDYKTTDLPAMSMFTEPMNTDTGGNIDLTFTLPSMKMEEIDEGSTPKYQHTKLRSERVAVREWGIAVGVTRRMIEDSRFNEVELALNEARRGVDRHLTNHVINAVFGFGDATLGTGSPAGTDIDTATLEGPSAGSITDFSTNIYGGFIANSGTVNTGRLYSYGNVDDADLIASHYVDAASGAAGVVSLSDITNAMKLIGAHGYNATTLVISPAHYKSLLDLADFQTVLSSTFSSNVQHVIEETDPFRNTLGTGIVGQLYGLNVFVNPWIASTRYGVFDLSTKPLAFVQRRALTVEEANPGFGIVGSYMSMRYGLKVVRPETGVIIINT
jgi:hypothetical protein